MSKVVVLGSEDCDTCQKIKKMIEATGSDVEYVNMDSEEGFQRATNMAQNGLKLEELDIPKCIIDYGDGTYDTCDEEDLFKKLKAKMGG